ncbi:cytochrome c [uncultured Jannaschia sp.]|uniref:c-type cytochrome n=1 Tax=uncultured Jannaschia sp. TaxID=293347 RepID=UPI00262A006C|nr:cytochrome c [uncultured Jannaschia sp.]
MRLAPLMLATSFLLTACQTNDRLPTEADIDASRGKALFAASCTGCHDDDGSGGIGPDLTGLSARAGGTFPEDYVMATIDGLDRHGDPEAVMPEFGAQGLGDTVIVEHDGLGTPVPADLLALTAFLRSIQD